MAEAPRPEAHELVALLTRVKLERFAAALQDGPGPPGAVKRPRVSHSKSGLYGDFVWARRALNVQKWRFPARAEGYVFVGDLADAEDADLAALGLKKPEVKRLRR